MRNSCNRPLSDIPHLGIINVSWVSGQVQANNNASPVVQRALDKAKQPSDQKEKHILCPFQCQGLRRSKLTVALRTLHLQERSINKLPFSEIMLMLNSTKRPREIAPKTFLDKNRLPLSEDVDSKFIQGRKSIDDNTSFL